MKFYGKDFNVLIMDLMLISFTSLKRYSLRWFSSTKFVLKKKKEIYLILEGIKYFYSYCKIKSKI